jgi:hypothetical protein
MRQLNASSQFVLALGITTVTSFAAQPGASCLTTVTALPLRPVIEPDRAHVIVQDVHAGDNTTPIGNVPAFVAVLGDEKCSRRRIIQETK